MNKYKPTKSIPVFGNLVPTEGRAEDVNRGGLENVFLDNILLVYPEHAAATAWFRDRAGLPSNKSPKSLESASKISKTGTVPSESRRMRDETGLSQGF